EKAARWRRGQVAVAIKDAVGEEFWRLAFGRQLKPFEMVQFLVGERIVGLGDIDFFPWLFDSRHAVGHPGGFFDVLRISEVAVGPISGIQAPAYTLNPNGLARNASRHLL